MNTTTTKKVYIILVNYNGWQDTIECLESLLKIDYPHYQIVIVDNDSPNESIKYITAWAEGSLALQEQESTIFKSFVMPYSKKPISYVLYNREEAEKGGNKANESKYKNPLVIIQSGYNGGFSFGNNVGIQYALARNDADYILLLNNDTIVKSDFLTELLKGATSSSSIGITGAKIYYYDEPNKLWFNGGTFNEWFGRTTHIKKESTQDISTCSFITGCCMLIKKEVIKKIGLLDESYFMYVEDLDYCYRARKAGFVLNVAHKSIIWHKVGASNEGELSEFAVRYMVKNHYKFIKKLDGLQKYCAFISFTIFRILSIIKWTLKGKANIAKIQLGAIIKR